MRKSAIYLVSGAAVLVALMVCMIFVMSYMKAYPQPYSDIKPDSPIPQFQQVNLEFKHQYDGRRFLPVMASAIIDLDNSGKPCLFLGGGTHQQDAVFKFDHGRFVDITTEVGLHRTDDDATYGATVIDMDNNGFADLIVARNSGGYIYYNQGGKFSLPVQFNTHLNPGDVPISFAVTSLKNNGFVDFYAAAYLSRNKMEGQNIFNKPGYGATSKLLLNDGTNKFTDITKDAGMEYVHNTFTGVFIDVDGDRLPELVSVHDTGQVQVWHNNGDLKFAKSNTPYSNVFGYPMGIAVGDYNNDGSVDFFFSNVGPTAPAFMAKGDLRADQVFFTQMMLFKNNGAGQFSNAASEAKLADYEFSWGTVFADLNLDGLKDLVIAENYVDLPFEKIFRLPGRVLLQRQDHTFASIETQAGLENREYGITPLFADFNDDGYPDLIWVNLNGKPKAFISKGGDANYLKVSLPESPQVLGAKVMVIANDGQTLTDWMISGQGLVSDQTHVLTFGLGKSSGVKSVTVQLLNGETKVIEAPAINKTLVISKATLGIS